MDYRYRFALGVFRDAGKDIELVAIGRYEGDETTKVAEPAFVVHEKFRRRDMADFLYDRLRTRAAACGLTSFEGSFSIENRASIELHRARGNDVYYSDGLYWYHDSLEALEALEATDSLEGQKSQEGNELRRDLDLTLHIKRRESTNPADSRLRSRLLLIAKQGPLF